MGEYHVTPTNTQGQLPRSSKIISEVSLGHLIEGCLKMAHQQVLYFTLGQVIVRVVG